MASFLRNLFLPLFFLSLLGSCSDKQHTIDRDLEKDKDYALACIAFYNVENLFDTTDSEDTEDREYTPSGPNNWTAERYKEKLKHLASVIGNLGTDKTPHGPAIIGLAEIENRKVLEDLVEQKPIASRNYRIVHHDSPDERGIDVAFLYRPDYFDLQKKESFKVELPEEGDKTRDQLLMSGKLLGERFHFMVAHWPSRSGGQGPSEKKRIAAARVGKEVIDSIRQAEKNPKIIYMGDLNDDPINKSVQEVLKAKGTPEALKNGELFNPMYALYEKGIGTLAWRDNWNLFDQILLSRRLVKGELSSLKYYTAKVHDPDKLKQKEGNFKGYPFRSYVGSTYQGGYSDHFPVYAFLIKESGRGKEK